MSTSGPGIPPTKNPELNKKSVAFLFAVGTILLVVPVGTVLSETAMCKSDVSACIHSEDYGFLVSSFPYLMLGGGVLIAFNMKRVSDLINSSLADEEGDEDSDDGSVASYS